MVALLQLLLARTTTLDSRTWMGGQFQALWLRFFYQKPLLGQALGKELQGLWAHRTHWQADSGWNTLDLLA